MDSYASLKSESLADFIDTAAKFRQLESSLDQISPGKLKVEIKAPEGLEFIAHSWLQEQGFFHEDFVWKLFPEYRSLDSLKAMLRKHGIKRVEESAMAIYRIDDIKKLLP